jgi:hypothetical protein
LGIDPDTVLRANGATATEDYTNSRAETPEDWKEVKGTDHDDHAGKLAGDTLSPTPDPTEDVVHSQLNSIGSDALNAVSAFLWIIPFPKATIDCKWP